MAFGDRVKKRELIYADTEVSFEVWLKGFEEAQKNNFYPPKQTYIQPSLNLPMSISPTWHWRWMTEKNAPDEWKFNHGRVNQPDPIRIHRGHFKVSYWFSNSLERKVCMQEQNCFISCNRQDKIWDCWLLHYPEHRCKYRLTLPKN